MEDSAPSLIQYFKGHTGPITSLSFSPNGKSLASSSEDNSFLIWNLTSNKASLRYKAKPCPVTHVAFSPQGNQIASSQSDYVRLWMTSVQGKSVEFKAHMGTVRSVEYSVDGEKLLTASNDKTLKLWNTCRRRFISSFIGHTNWVKLAKWSPEGDMIVSCSDDRSSRLWDPRSHKVIHTFNELKGSPRYVSFHPTGTCIGVAMSHGVAKLYDLRTMKLLQYYPCHTSTVNSLAFHPSGAFMITGSDDNTNKVMDLLEGRVIYTLEAHSKAVTALEFSKAGDLFATASEDKNVFVWSSNFERETTEGAGGGARPAGGERAKAATCLRESVANNYDPTKPKIQIKTSTLNLNSTQIEDVYSPKDYEDKCGSANKENEPVRHNSSSSVDTPRETPAAGLTKGNKLNLNGTAGDGLLSLLDTITYENEVLRNKMSFLTEKVSSLENSEDCLKKKLFSMEERLSRLELHTSQQNAGSAGQTQRDQ